MGNIYTLFFMGFEMIISINYKRNDNVITTPTLMKGINNRPTVVQLLACPPSIHKVVGSIPALTEHKKAVVYPTSVMLVTFPSVSKLLKVVSLQCGTPVGLDYKKEVPCHWA
ncbi:uncharacterized protein LOC142220853 [Haematobia irritans]|uniref:uncharacterized protein LOC142220853 n=1 Tax=Haematobia irritans TaxID=7368 RepID=UPI003F4F6A98